MEDKLQSMEDKSEDKFQFLIGKIDRLQNHLLLAVIGMSTLFIGIVTVAIAIFLGYSN